ECRRSVKEIVVELRLHMTSSSASMPEKPSIDPNTIIGQISRGATRGGGFAGKICYALMIVSLAMAAIAWPVKVVWVSVVAVALVFILAFVMLWRLINLAEKSPHSAMMEGKELLIHEQLTVRRKGDPKESVQAAVERIDLQAGSNQLLESSGTVIEKECE
ncbi:MAG: hypothetical protein ACPG6P_14335, partial [Akkermansiaceae bacterium]